jgi:hypothetical protein
VFPVIWYFLFGSWFGQSGGRVLANGYQGGRSSLSSLVGRLGHGSSSPSVDDLSGFTSRVLVPAMSPSPSNASTPLRVAPMFSNLENIEFPVSATSPKSQLGSLVSGVKGLLRGLVPTSHKKKRCSHRKRCTRAKAKDRFWRWRR